MKPLSTVASIIALVAASASAAPVPHTHDRLTRPDAGAGSQKADRKVSSWLRAAKGGGDRSPARSSRPTRRARPTASCRCTWIARPSGAEQVAALERAGLTVDGVDSGRGRVRGSIDAALLDRVAEFSWVHAVRPVDRAVVRAGSTTTEGDAAAQADLVRVQGLDGSGVVVGVISDGIDHVRDAQQSGDLPDVTVPERRLPAAAAATRAPRCSRSCTTSRRARSCSSPGPRDSFEMVQAVQCLTAAGADVIVDDLGFFGEPYFQDGPVAAAVRTAVRAGVSYHSSAGNEAQQHLEQDFVATPNSTLHDFAGGAGDNTKTVVVPPGGTLTCILQWNDPFGGSANDYDLFLLDQNLSLVAQSIDPQTGAQDPIEVVAVSNRSNSDAIAHLVIDRFGQSAAAAAGAVLSRCQRARARDAWRQHHRPRRRSTRW